jgi:hypothetical protein
MTDPTPPAEPALLRAARALIAGEPPSWEDPEWSIWDATSRLARAYIAAHEEAEQLRAEQDKLLAAATRETPDGSFLCRIGPQAIFARSRDEAVALARHAIGLDQTQDPTP